MDNEWQPLAFFSKRLQDRETRYSTFGRELLAAYLGIRHFRHLLEGRSFTLFTDHKPLTYALNSKPDRHSPREIRQVDFISQFTSDIRHVSGKDNIPADAFSRVHIDSLHLHASVDFDAIARAQEDDEEIANLSDDDSISLQRVPIYHPQTRPFCVICQLALHVLKFHPLSVSQFSALFIISHIQGLELLRSCVLNVLYGKESTGMYAYGPRPASSARNVRCIVTPNLHWEHFQCQTRGLHMYIST